MTGEGEGKRSEAPPSEGDVPHASQSKQASANARANCQSTWEGGRAAASMQNGPEERLAATLLYAGPGFGSEDRTRLGNATKSERVPASAAEQLTVLAPACGKPL